MKKWITFLALLFTAGCGSLIPQQRTESASIKTTEAISAAHDAAIEKVIEGEKSPVPVVTPPPNITVSGSSNNVSVRIDSPARVSDVDLDQNEGARNWTARPAYRATTSINSESRQGGNSSEEASSLLKRRIPLWVALIGGGIGILILTFAIKYALTAIKSSAAGAAALRVADEGIARVVTLAESHAASSTDMGHAATLQSIAKTLEATRGKAGKLA